jgi:hypothetical protein
MRFLARTQGLSEPEVVSRLSAFFACQCMLWDIVYGFKTAPRTRVMLGALADQLQRNYSNGSYMIDIEERSFIAVPKKG